VGWGGGGPVILGLSGSNFGSSGNRAQESKIPRNFGSSDYGTEHEPNFLVLGKFGSVLNKFGSILGLFCPARLQYAWIPVHDIMTSNMMGWHG